MAKAVSHNITLHIVHQSSFNWMRISSAPSCFLPLQCTTCKSAFQWSSCSRFMLIVVPAQYFAVLSIEVQSGKVSLTLTAYIWGVQYLTHSNKQCEKKKKYMQAKIAKETNKDPADTRDYKKPSLDYYTTQASTWYFFKTFKCTGNIHDC